MKYQGQKLLILIFLLCATSAIHAQQRSLKVKGLFVSFNIKNAGIKVNGSFKKGSATLLYNEANPLLSKFSGTVDISSINTGIDARDNHLRDKKEYFDMAIHPKINIESVSVSKNATGAYAVTWNVTMKGKSKQITAPLTIVKSDTRLAFTSTFSLNRRDWGVGGKSIVMNDNVNVTITVNAL
jgi:polyisoprenoid-binding protein YceI